MKLQQLEIFVTTIECGTLTKAAEKLFLAQPVLSLSIKELESELGVFLLNRSNTGIAPTPVGKEVYRNAKNVLALVERIRQIPPDQNHASLKHQFAASYFGGHALLLETFLALQSEGKNCQSYELFDQHERMETEAIFGGVEDGTLTLGVVYSYSYAKTLSPVFPEKRGLHLDYLGRDPFCIVVRNGHPLQQKKVRLSDLSHYPNAVYESSLNDYIRVVYGEEYCLKETIRIENHTGLRNYLSQTDAVSAITQSELTRSNRIHSSSLNVLDLKEVQWYQDVYCVRRPGELTFPAYQFLQKLIAVARQYLSS